MQGTNQLQQQKNAVRKSETITGPEQELLIGDFLHQLNSGEEIQSDYTLAKHIKNLRHITNYNENIDLADLDPSLEQNKKIRNQIQESKYKKQKGEYAVRTKRDHWTVWKYLLKHEYNINLERTDLLPPVSFSSNEEDVDKQAETSPKDLPTPKQMRKLLPAIRKCSKTKVADRNAAFFLLLWDTGARRNEARPIKLKDVDHSKDRLRVHIKGNKSSQDRWNTIYQGEQFLREYIANHPGSGEDYLFPRSYQNKLDEPVSGTQLVKKMRQAKASAGLDFKTYGEPLHIFRKAMSTFWNLHITDWSTICDRQAKGEETKPDYILRALEDREVKEAEGFGLEKKKSGNPYMADDPLLPQKCSCGEINHCLKQYCGKCGEKLEDSQLQRSEKYREEEEQEKELSTGAQNALETLKEEGLLEDL